MNKKTEKAAAQLLKRMRKCLVEQDRNLAAQVRGMEKMDKLISTLIRVIERDDR